MYRITAQDLEAYQPFFEAQVTAQELVMRTMEAPSTFNGAVAHFRADLKISTILST